MGKIEIVIGCYAFTTLLCFFIQRGELNKKVRVAGLRSNKYYPERYVKPCKFIEEIYNWRVEVPRFAYISAFVVLLCPILFIIATLVYCLSGFNDEVAAAMNLYVILLIPVLNILWMDVWGEKYKKSSMIGEIRMLEFKGYVSGASEIWYHKKKNYIFDIKLFLYALFLILPGVGILILGIKKGKWAILVLYVIVFIVIPLLIPICRSKNRKATTPKRIFTDGEIITCITDISTETHYIKDVKLLKDHGEFYELVFPFDKGSKNFVCQKNLLVGGTLEDFEMIFEKNNISICRDEQTGS